MTYDIQIMDIMKEIGCADGFHIPVANEENQLLEKEIKELLKKKAALLVTDETLDSELQEHQNIITNLLSNETQNQKLIVANRQQYETEQHMLIAAQRDNDDLSRENKAAAKKLKELTEEHANMENEITKNEEKIKEMRETIEWGEETLLAWNNDLSKKNMDINILEAYHLEDNNRFKELDLRRQYLQRDVIERESIVEKEVAELLRVERELEQTSKLTKQAQRERNHLLEQWENAANFLNSNQKETHTIVKEIAKIRDVARTVYENMNENKQKYQDYLEANEELEREMDEAHKINNDLNLSIINHLSNNDNMQSEVLAAQKALNILGNMLTNERTKRRHMKNEQVKLQTQIQQREKDIEKLKDELSNIKTKSMTTEERLNELNKIYEDQSALKENLLTKKNEIVNMTFNVKNEIKQVQSKIDLLKNQLEQGRSKQMMLCKDESKLKKLVMDRKENLYNLNFKLETIRMKIAEAKGTVDIEEMHDLQEKLRTLNEELSRVEDNKNQLEQQLRLTEIESHRITKEIEKNAIELEMFRNRVEELNILNEGGEKQVQSLKEQNNRYHLEEMMMKLKMEQMMKLTKNECKKIYSLEQQRNELTQDVNKRKSELVAIGARINSEKKSLAEEKSAAKRKLDALVQCIDQRRNKYQILLATMGTTFADGDGGEWSSISTSEYRIRLAQEKAELQETGDGLDERVQKLETEIRAMENTLRVLNASNGCYKSSLSSVNPASDEYKDKMALEETYENLNSAWLEKKKTLENLEIEIRDLEDRYKTCNEELESLIRLRDIKNSELSRAIEETNEQMTKLNRANSRIQFDMKQINKNCDPDKRSTLELIKRDITVRMAKKTNKCVLEQLSEMSVRHIGVEPTVKQYLSDKDLELPTVSGLTFNCKVKSSCGSSTASLNSSSSSCNSSAKRLQL